MDIMTKVRVLWEKVTGLTADVSAVETQAVATAATLDGILPRIPADYSTSETPTGVKWIDGKPIYHKVVIIEPDETATGSTESKTFSIDGLNILKVSGYCIRGGEIPFYMPINNYNSSATYSSLTWYSATATHKIAMTTGYYGGAYIELLYTKNDPVPAQVDKGTGMITGEDPEPEPETKKRKTTKKEDK